MSQFTVQLLDATKRIGRKTIVQDLNFSVQKGEVFGLLGPNGAGKTTTIRMMVGLMAISDGEILIQGKSIRADFTKAIAHVGAIVESPEFYNFLTGYQNLFHYLKLSRQAGKDRIDEVASFLGMENYLHDQVKTYSLGMKQRLGIAQALLDRPSVLILDEPTNGLDPVGIKELREHLRFLARHEGVSVIVSSHILSEMELLCDRAAIIKKGRLLDVTSLNEFGHCSVRFEVDDILRAQSVIAQNFPGMDCTVAGNWLEVQVNHADTARINTCLVGSSVQVFRIQPKVKSLEEVFMEVTVE